jgi:hypothetical protein
MMNGKVTVHGQVATCNYMGIWNGMAQVSANNEKTTAKKISKRLSVRGKFDAG